MHEGLLKEAPEWRELVAGVEDCRSGRKSIAIVMPTYKSNPMTEKHLDILAKQTCQDFDVVLVYGQEDAFLEREGMVHIRRKGNYGSAGAFFIGEAFALEEGYETVILADNDCLPVSADLVEKLQGGIDDGLDLVFPKISNTPDDCKVNWVIAQYGCIRSQTLKEVGLSYIPFFFSGEDYELHWRMKNRRTATVDAVATHPYLTFFSLDKKRIYYYQRARIAAMILRGEPWRVFSDMFSQMMFGGILALLRPDLAVPLWRAILDGSSMMFFSDETTERYLSGDHETQEAHGIEIDKGRHWTLDPIKGILSVPESFGKDVIYDRFVGIGGLISALTARRSRLKLYGRYYRVFDNRHFFLSPMVFAAVVLGLPFALTGALALTAYGFAKKTLMGLDSYGYGIDKDG